MTATASQVIAVAASQIGYYARPGSVSKFGQWYGIPHGQWCAMFLSWCASQTGATDIIPRHAYTPAGVAWFRTRGAWHVGSAGIQRGDLAYFDFPGRPNRVSHVGIVETVHRDGSVTTIDGNTSGNGGGDQRNGGLVARKRRSSFIVGYGRPRYARATRPNRSRRRNADGSLALAINGVRGSTDIARWQEVMAVPINGSVQPGFSPVIKADQEFLNSVVAASQIRDLTGRSSLAVDGDEGPRTIKVRQFWLRNAMSATHQHNLIGRLLDFDGALGPQTNKVFEFALNNARRGTKRYGQA